MSSSRPSGSVIAAGVIAILGSCLAILGCGLALIGTAFLPSTSANAQLPANAKSLMLAVMLFLLAIAVFGVFTGAGILRLKNWARISALIWAGVTVCFSSLTLLFTMFMPFPSPPGEQPVPVVMLKAFLFVFYAIPLGISIWWLILFNGQNARALFSGLVIPDQPGVVARPHCPLPVAVIAGFFVFSFMFVLVFPLFHIPLPVILFGRRIPGLLGSSIFALTAILMLVAAVGLLKLKRWGYPLILAVQVFWLVSGAFTFLGSSYEANMRQVLEDMHMSQSEAPSQIYLFSGSWVLVVGLVPGIVILAILLYYRKQFQDAAEAAEKMDT